MDSRFRKKLFSDREKIHFIENVIYDRYEFLTAPAPDRIRRAECIPERIGDHAQYLISNRVTIGIIDILELVNIHKEQSGWTLVMFYLCDRSMQTSLKMQAIADFGQWVGLYDLVHIAQATARVDHGLIIAKGFDRTDNFSHPIPQRCGADEHRQAVPVGVMDENFRLSGNPILHDR